MRLGSANRSAMTRLAGWITVAAALGSTGVLALLHLGDNDNVDFVGGIWSALARATADGTFYPPLRTGTTFGGTRYAPGAIGLQGLITKALDDPVLAGKLISLLTFGALLAAVARILTRLGVPAVVAVLGASTIAVNTLGQRQVLRIHNDAVPALLQIAAVAIVASNRSRRSDAVAAGAACGLALVFKTSALWGVATIVVWLFRRDRRLISWAAGAWATVAAAGYLIGDAASHGRMWTNVRTLSFGHDEGLAGSLRLAPFRLFGAMAEESWLLLTGGAVIVAAMWAMRDRLGPWPLALGFSGLMLLGLFVDRGVSANHVLDFATLLVINGAAVWFVIVDRSIDRDAATLTLAAIVAVGALSLPLASLNEEMTVRMRGDDPSIAVDNVLAALPDGANILTDQPWLDVQRGRTPVVLDAFAFRRLAQRHPDWRDELITRIHAQEFDTVVLVAQLDEPVYSSFHFGPDVRDAIAASYRLDRVVDHYWFYVRR